MAGTAFFGETAGFASAAAWFAMGSLGVVLGGFTKLAPAGGVTWSGFLIYVGLMYYVFCMYPF